MSLSDHRTRPAKRYSKLVLFLLASLSCTGSALIAQQRYVAFQDGFGAGDTPAFVVWLTPLSVLVGIVALALGRLRCDSWLRHTLSIIIGLVGGYLWTMCVSISLGPWFGAFSFPVLYFFMLGGVVGLLLGSLYVSLYGAREK